MSFKEEVRRKVFEKLEIGLSDASIKSLQAVKQNPKLELVAVPKGATVYDIISGDLFGDKFEHRH